jgi:hypothetical protein
VIQNFYVQVQVALRALEEVVAPALGSTEKHVVEQLMLSIATIGFVKTRLPEARRFYRLELHNCIELAEEVARITSSSDTLAETINMARCALADPEADIAEFETASRRLRDLVTALSHSSVGQPYQAQLDAAILEKSGALVAQYRLWCAPFGFELQLDNLPEPAW